MTRHIKLYYGEDPAGQGFAWPDSEAKRTEYFQVKRAQPYIAESVYQCRPGAREGSIFLESDFAYYEPPDGLEMGPISPAVRAFINRGHIVAMGWDTAFEATNAADWSVGITGLLVRCSKYHRGENEALLGPCEPHFDVMIMDVLREKLDWAGLVPAFRRQHMIWAPAIHIIEKRGSGITLFQVMQNAGINVLVENVAENKRARALQGVGAGSVQGWFRQHRVLLPLGAPWVDNFKKELKDFSGAKDAIDDQVDAAVHLIVYAIRQSFEAAMMPSDWDIDRVDQMMGVTAFNERLASGFRMGSAQQWDGVFLLGAISQLPSAIENPFAETCGTCANKHQGLCRVQIRPVSDIEPACSEFSARNAA